MSPAPIVDQQRSATHLLQPGVLFIFLFCQRSKCAYHHIVIFSRYLLSLNKEKNKNKNKRMSSNSTSPVATESTGSLSSSGFSSISATSCDDRTCSAAKCALCLHCSQEYCFAHFLTHNEQLSLKAYNFSLDIDLLGKSPCNLSLEHTHLFALLQMIR